MWSWSLTSRLRPPNIFWSAPWPDTGFIHRVSHPPCCFPWLQMFNLWVYKKLSPSLSFLLRPLPLFPLFPHFPPPTLHIQVLTLTNLKFKERTELEGKRAEYIFIKIQAIIRIAFLMYHFIYFNNCWSIPFLIKIVLHTIVKFKKNFFQMF